MTRFLSALTAVLLALVGLYHWYAPPPVSPGQPTSSRPARVRDQRLAEEFTRFSNFAYSEMLGKYYRREIALDEAVERVYLFSVTNYPDYLIEVSEKYQGQTLREKVARALLTELRAQLAHTINEDETRAEVESRLDAELQKYRRTLYDASHRSSAGTDRSPAA